MLKTTGSTFSLDWWQTTRILRAPALVAVLSAGVACSAAAPPASVAPTGSVVYSSEDLILNQICQQLTVDVSINKCGDFYSAYPIGFVVDAATEIFDKDGKHIDSCGGYRFYASEDAREESERNCAAYLSDCTQVVASCSVRLRVFGGNPRE